jgi:tetratricopeptide (TPR) repeat protein
MLINHYIENPQDRTEILLKLAKECRLKGNYKHASILIFEAILKKPNSIKCYEKFSINFFLAKDYNNSIKYCTKTIELNNYNTRAFLLRGICYKELKLYDKALEDFNTVLKIDKVNIHALRNRASTYYIIGDLKKSLNDYKKIYFLKPECSKTLAHSAKIFFNMKKYKKSIENITAYISSLIPNNNKNMDMRKFFLDTHNLYESCIKRYNYTCEMYWDKLKMSNKFKNDDYSKFLKYCKNNYKFKKN